jgi:hypothetical protein
VEGDLVGGGAYTQIGTNPANNIAKWTGSSWEPIVLGSHNGFSGPVNDILFLSHSIDSCEEGTNCSPFDNPVFFVGGEFVDALGTRVNKVAACFLSEANDYREHRCEPLYDYNFEYGISNGHVNALAWDGCDNEVLYVGGKYDQAGSVNANNISYWDFEDDFGWHSFDEAGYRGTNYDVYTLAIDQECEEKLSKASSLQPGNSTLYLGGAFTMVGDPEFGDGGTANYVASWNYGATSPDTKWNALDDVYYGASGPVNALIWHNYYANLYVGGDFKWAGDVANTSNNVAAWYSEDLLEPWEIFCNFPIFELGCNSPFGATQTGTNGPVKALAELVVHLDEDEEEGPIYNDLVYMGGFFSKAGGAHTYNVACYNNNTEMWCDGVNMSIDSPVSALLVAPSLCLFDDEENCFF